jgi:hypothetical protein
MTTQHTSQPWKVRLYFGKTQVYRCTPGTDCVETVLFELSGKKGAQEEAIRWTQCVNSCTGITNPEALPDVVEALRFCQMALADISVSRQKGYISEAFKLSIEALRKLEGKA